MVPVTRFLEFPLQEFNGIDLDQHIMVKVFDLVALGARVTVDALVLAAPVQVHVVVQPEPIIRTFNAGKQGFGLDLLITSLHLPVQAPSAPAGHPHP